MSVQWLGLLASTTGGPGSIPGQGTNPVSRIARPNKQTNKKPQNNHSPSSAAGPPQFLP